MRFFSKFDLVDLMFEKSELTTKIGFQTPIWFYGSFSVGAWV
jgi:hypothetical protein